MVREREESSTTNEARVLLSIESVGRMRRSHREEESLRHGAGSYPSCDEETANR